MTNVSFHSNQLNSALINFVKKTDKTHPKELALARMRMKEWKNIDA